MVMVVGRLLTLTSKISNEHTESTDSEQLHATRSANVRHFVYLDKYGQEDLHSGDEWNNFCHVQSLTSE
jgi:hypothetical protein